MYCLQPNDCGTNVKKVRERTNGVFFSTWAISRKKKQFSEKFREGLNEFREIILPTLYLEVSFELNINIFQVQLEHRGGYQIKAILLFVVEQKMNKILDRKHSRSLRKRTAGKQE